MIIAFSSELIFRVRLSVERNETDPLNLVVSIRDQFNSIRLYDLLPIRVYVDTTEMDSLINTLEDSKAELTSTRFVQLLSGRNQVGQIFTSIARELEQRNGRQMSSAASRQCSGKGLFHPVLIFSRWTDYHWSLRLTLNQVNTSRRSN
jgi:hypothetical protein